MSEIRKRRATIQFEKRNIDILKRRLGHFSHLPMYQSIAYVLSGTAHKKELYSLDEWGSALFQVYERTEEYLDEYSGRLTRLGYGALAAILTKIRKNDYKKKFDMFKPYCLEFEDPLGIKDNRGRFPIHSLLAPLRKHKDLDEIIKKHKQIINGYMRSNNDLEIMRATDIRKLNKKIEKLAQEGEGEIILGNHKGNKQ